jgi:hypothetical protein
VLKSAFAMFSLKSPSLLDFKEQAVAEEKNRVPSAIVS